MKNIITIALLILTSAQLISQELNVVDTQTLNVRESAGTEYRVVDKIHKNDTVILLSEQGGWTHIETSEGLKGYVSSSFLVALDISADSSPKKEKEESIWFYILIGIVIVGAIFGGSSKKKRTSSSSKKRKKKKVSSNSSKSGVVYRFRVIGNGTAGTVQYTDGMNVEVAVNGLGASGSPFNSAVKELFVKEFAKKYNIDPRFQSGIKMLFKKDRLEVEVL